MCCGAVVVFHVSVLCFPEVESGVLSLKFATPSFSCCFPHVLLFSTCSVNFPVRSPTKRKRPRLRLGPFEVKNPIGQNSWLQTGLESPGRLDG